MTANCMKPKWNDRCCCNCKYQRWIFKHPWNNGDGKGSVNDIMGFGCAVEGAPVVIFMDDLHGMCEMHERKELPE